MGSLAALGIYLCLAGSFICGVATEKSFPHLEHVKTFIGLTDQTDAVRDLVRRIVGDRSSDFDVKVNTPVPESGNDIVIIANPSTGKIKISGTSGVAVAFGLNHYLKYYCNKQMSWAGDNLSNIPSPLPPVPDGRIELKAAVKYRYYQNVCTVSYSFVWWNWTRWEREIDWMAMNGINLPLAFTGQEAIWKKVYKQLGCSDDDLNNFFAGPAFLAWGRMGNINKWGGPLPISWIEIQAALQNKILAHMRAFGMIPVLPGFAGHIPEAITKLYKVNATRLSHWSHFNCTYSCTYLLEPMDPMFTKIGKMFIEEQINEYNGTNHIYNADTFNEMTPRSDDPTYLSETASAVFEAMVAGDDKAIWLMQGWLFVNNPVFWRPAQQKALLTAVPQGRLVILDLFSESNPDYAPTHSYYGQPFLWCMLHNFGGNTGFYGKIETVNKGPSVALAYPNSTMIGTGLTPEGINQNYIMYDLMLEVGFFVTPRNLTDWVSRFVERRYGSSSALAKQAWLLLAATVYNDTGAGYPPKRTIRGPLVDRPTTNVPQSPSWYNQTSIGEAWNLFMAAFPDLPTTETAQYDLVDLARQWIQYLHFDAQVSLLKAFNSQDAKAVNDSSTLLLNAIDSMEEILATNIHFSMEMWIGNARALGSNDVEKDLYEFNARNQVTLWGPNGEIHDYASKEWSYLMSHYYRPRWALFIDYVKDCVATGKHFNHGKFSQDVFENVELPFTKEKLKFSKKNRGDPFTVSRKIFKRWIPIGFMSKRPK